MQAKFWLFNENGYLKACFNSFERAQAALKNNPGWTLVVANTYIAAKSYIGVVV